MSQIGEATFAFVRFGVEVVDEERWTIFDDLAKKVRISSFCFLAYLRLYDELKSRKTTICCVLCDCINVLLRFVEKKCDCTMTSTISSNFVCSKQVTVEQRGNPFARQCSFRHYSVEQKGFSFAQL